MAALQKIRSKGGLLIVIIGLGLFAFIAEEFFRSIETTANQSRQQVGKIYGKNLSTQDFQSKVESYENVVKFMRGVTPLTEQEATAARDQVWQLYVNKELIGHEAQKLGLTVTDGELQQVLNEGTLPALQQTPFSNQETGRFDAALLKNFLNEYDKLQSGTEQVPQQLQEYYANLYNYWKFMEQNLRDQLLEQKYQVLLYKSILSNPVEAKQDFEGNEVKNNISLVAFPYSIVPDANIKVSDAEIEAKYNETKEDYRNYLESRDIKYISVAVTASEKDQAELTEEMNNIATKLAQTDDVASVVRSSNSLITYAPLPVTKNAFPADIQLQLDSIQPGTLKGPYRNAGDNTENIIKLIAKTQAPDSIMFQQIQVGGETPEEAHQRADSIYAALQGGATMKELAGIYGQTADSTWLTSAQYERSQIDDENARFISAINSLGNGQTTHLSFAGGNIILKVIARKNPVTKYDVAVIKRTVDFSKETYSKAYNDFSHFVATNTTLKDIEQNAAKEGYSLLTRNELYNNEHYIAGISNTRDALKWVFDEAKPGDISPLYECGDNDHLLLVALTKVHKEGYRPLEEVKELVRASIVREKKADQLAQSLANVKSVAEAQAVQGAVTDSINDIYFGQDAFIKATGSVEPALSGSLWEEQNGSFVGPVKGNNGVYVYQILDQTKQEDEFNDKQQEERAAQLHARNLNNLLSDLYIKAKVVDKRYLFF